MELRLERQVPHPPREMFNLVADLEGYPRFIPNCKAMLVRSDPNSAGVLATMTLRFGPITQGYTSRVMLDRENCTVTATAVDGPFRYLDSRWTFAAEGQGTRIHFWIRFKISNALIAAVAEPAFASKQDEILNAFVREANRRFAR